MKIIKQGNKQESDKKIFKCDNCSCEFECGTNEYYTDTNPILIIPKKVYAASCPCCHKICNLEETTVDWSTTTVTQPWNSHYDFITRSSSNSYLNITPTGTISVNESSISSSKASDSK